MLETLLILLAGGLLFGDAVRGPGLAATSPWHCRKASIALAMCGLALIAYLIGERPGADVPAFFRRIQAGLLTITLMVVLTRFRAAGSKRLALLRVLSAVGFVLAVLAGSNLLHDEMLAARTAVAVPPKAASVALQTLVCAGTAAVIGLSLTCISSCVAPAPGQPAAAGRYDGPLTTALVLRGVSSIGAVAAIAAAMPQHRHVFSAGLLATAIARWLIGIGVPLVLLTLAARRRREVHPGHFRAAAAAVLVLIGEIVALCLVRATGLPF